MIQLPFLYRASLCFLGSIIVIGMGMIFPPDQASAQPKEGGIDLLKRQYRRVRPAQNHERPARKPCPDKIRGEHRKGEILVKFNEGVTETQIADIHKQIGAEIVSEIRALGIQNVRGINGQSTEELMCEYSKFPEVYLVEPIRIFRKGSVPNDPEFSKLWGLHNIGQTINELPYGVLTFTGTSDADVDAPVAWDLQTGNGNLLVAVIDSGVDYSHPDLIDNISTTPGFDFCSGTTLNDPTRRLFSCKEIIREHFFL